MTEVRGFRRLCPGEELLALLVEQGVLLWSMRMRVIELKRGTDVEAHVSDVLDTLGVAAAWPFVRDFVDALSDSCTRYIDIQCVCKPTVGPDECALLDVLSLAQALRPFEATLVLRQFVTQAGAVAALGHAEGIGTVLAQTGRFLPEPDETVRRFALAPAAGLMPSCGHTLH